MRLALLVVGAAVLGGVATAGVVLAAGDQPLMAQSAVAQSPGRPSVGRVLPEPSIIDQDAPYREACRREGLSASECVGRLIWFKATAGNARFHAYTFPQRIGVLIDWFRVLRTDERDDRFYAWGIINDPACCRPGDPNCPAKTPEDTFGFDWCPGDDVLLKYVGKPGYVDPACALHDAPLDPDDPHSARGTTDQRQSACDLAFGTSTGALGFRKFPNPRFDIARWRALNGTLASWEGFSSTLMKKTGVPSDARASRLADASYEPPFLIGLTCGACHIGFDPAHPPENPAHPEWADIRGLIGNQYSHITEVLGSGMPTSSLEWQMFAHPRPGVTDTSAVAHDQVNNPGTINALINLSQRPTFSGEAISKWRKTDTCAANADEARCWCEPGRDGKCWRHETRSDDTTSVYVGGARMTLPGVHHMLKGGEDSIGAREAIQRVYLNIGSCAEQCWANHLTDFRELDPDHRGFGQTPVVIGACRRDCPNFRAIEDRLGNVLDFLFSAESDATDLYVARDRARQASARAQGRPAPAPYTRNDLVRDLETEFGRGAVARGRAVFAQRCARCHSSIDESSGGPFASRDFAATVADHPRQLRADFLGNDQAIPATEVGTFRCRSLHSNNVAGHLYMDYGSAALRGRPIVPDIPERDELKDEGRGYYRNPSLINAWATAPFMHNNAIGPELCGKPANGRNDFFRSRYVDGAGNLLAEQPACMRYDPSVEGRYALYKRSMHDLLHPSERGMKTTLTTEPVIIDIGVRSWDGHEETPLGRAGRVTLPAGIPAGFLNGLEHKLLIDDLFLAEQDPGVLEKAGKGDAIPALLSIAERLLADPQRFADLFTQDRDFLSRRYETCTETIENQGHRFGEDLSESDKNALTAFLATL